MKITRPLIVSVLLMSSLILSGQIETYWFSDPDAAGFRETDGMGGESNASTWEPRRFTLTNELSTTAFVNSFSPSDIVLTQLAMTGPLSLSKLSPTALLIDYESVHRTFLDRNGLQLNNEDGVVTLKSFTADDAGHLELFTKIGSTSQWLARMGPSVSGEDRGSLRLYGTDGFEKIEFTVDDNNKPFIEAKDGLSIMSIDDAKADITLKGKNTNEVDGIIESDPDYANSNLLFNANGSILFTLDKDNNGAGLHPFVIQDANLNMAISAENGMYMEKASSGVNDPHIVIADKSSNSYGRLNIGNLNTQYWQIAGKPTGSSTQKYLLFHLSDPDGTTGDDLIQLRGDGNAFIEGVWAPISDRRLKKDIVKVENSLEKLSSLNGYNYNWKDPNKPDPQTGVIAQEVQKVFPNLVLETSTGDLSVNYDGLIPHLIEAIKTQNERINQLEEIVKELKSN